MLFGYLETVLAPPFYSHKGGIGLHTCATWCSLAWKEDPRPVASSCSSMAQYSWRSGLCPSGAGATCLGTPDHVDDIIAPVGVVHVMISPVSGMLVPVD
jgi:hypothetical protein